MGIDKNQRDLESGIHTDLSGRLTYGGYLRLDQLLHGDQLFTDEQFTNACGHAGGSVRGRGAPPR